MTIASLLLIAALALLARIVWAGAGMMMDCIGYDAANDYAKQFRMTKQPDNV